MALIAANKSYDIYLTSTPPRQLRFRILNADASFKVRLSVYYTMSNRIDLYTNGSFVLPTNGYYQDGNMLIRDPSTNMPLYMPTPASASGANLFIKADSKIYFAMAGSDYIDLKYGLVLFLRFGMPAITEDSFFDPANLVLNFAALLNIDPKMIRYVNIVRASSSGRRKRDGSSTSDLIYVELKIFENPVVVANDTNEYAMMRDRLAAIEANATNQFVTGELGDKAAEKFNVSMETMSVQKVDIVNASVVEIKKLNDVRVLVQPSDCREQSPCGVQPVVVVIDENVTTIFFFFTSKYSFE